MAGHAAPLLYLALVAANDIACAFAERWNRSGYGANCAGCAVDDDGRGLTSVFACG
ncbi:MAG: hypothetical protein ACLTHL_07915 [Collinsella sp.]